MKSVYKVAIVDDHAIFRNGITTALNNSEFMVCLEASSGMELIEKLQKIDQLNFPDLFIIDINMPVMGGIDTVNWLNTHFQKPRIIICSMHSEPEIVINLVRKGIKSYITKDLSADELIHGLSAAAKDNFYFPESITKIIVEAHQKEIGVNKYEFTDKENDIIQLFASELTYSEIAQRLKISPRTVDVYRDKIFQKLNVKSRTGMVMKLIKEKIIALN